MYVGICAYILFSCKSQIVLPSFFVCLYILRRRGHDPLICGHQKAKPFPMLMCQETSLRYLVWKNWKNCQKTIDLLWLVTTASGNSDLFPDSVSQRWPAVKEEKWAAQPAMSEGWCLCMKCSMSCQCMTLRCKCRNELTSIHRTQLLQLHDMMKDRC